MALSDRIKTTRELRKLSQQDLADRTGISVRQILRYENGDSDPTAAVLSRIARELEVSADYLLGFVDNPTEHVREEDLTPDERELVFAYKNKRYKELILLLAGLIKGES